MFIVLILIISGCVDNVEINNLPDTKSNPTSNNNKKVNQVESRSEQQNLCESKTSFSEKNICYTSEAKAKKDQTICYKIGKDLAINDCLFDVATIAGSAELCKEIPIENDKIICLFHVGSKGKDLEGCKNLPDNDVDIIYKTGSKSKAKKDQCFIGFYVNVADEDFEKFDKSVCDYFEKKNECLDRISKLKGDYTTCDTISCVIDIAKSNKDLSLCDEARRLFEGNWDRVIQEDCKEPIAIEKGDASVCKTTSCFFSVAQKLKDISICFMGGSRYCYEDAIYYDADLTIDDCKVLKEKCVECFKETYDECLFRVLIKNQNLKEEDCNIISDESIKRKCLYQAYES